MATRYPSDYNRYNRVEPGISRDRRGGAAPRSGYGDRRQGYGQRPPQRSAGDRRQGYSQRPADDRRQGYGQRPPQRPVQPGRGNGRRRGPNRAPAFAALAALLVVVLVLVIGKPFGRPAGNPTPDVPVSIPVDPTVGAVQTDAGSDVAAQPDALAEKLADAEAQVGSLSADQMAQVDDLKINTGLPTEWLNVLLMGTDERTLSDSARTDAMMICSINRNTGEVKLSSIMRDLAIEYTDIGQWNGTYRVNAANYFGGPKLAMRTINEKFGMNIQYYVLVNFFGFQKIAQRLGGIDVDITEAEKDKINQMIVQQAKFAYNAGIDESDQENVYLETFGENTHLNGRQTLAYARIRKLTGGDAMRTERQRIVLQKLMEKAKGLDAIQLAALASEMIDQVKTNLPFDDMFTIAMQVCGNGLDGLKALRLPVNGTYKEETRREQSMLYDCDFDANALELYNFIYEG